MSRGIPVHYQKYRKVNGKFTHLVYGVTSELNHTIYVGRWPTSAVYFKSRAFKVESVNKLEKSGTEKAKIHKHNNTK